jgi:NAD(P)-dependent dehydrogenase (short-subunit alcohol dehydrogenase family)
MKMFSPTFRLDGKKAIVTVAGRGIGRALAIGLVEAGADVAFLSRTIEDLNETASLVKSFKRQALIIPTDVSKREEVRQAVGQVVQEWGPGFDILINNAGMNIRTKSLDVTDNE